MNDREFELMAEIVKQILKRSISRYGWRAQPTVSVLPLDRDLWQVQLGILIAPETKKLVRYQINSDDVLSMRSRIDTTGDMISSEVMRTMDAPEGFWKQFVAEGIGEIQSVNN